MLFLTIFIFFFIAFIIGLALAIKGSYDHNVKCNRKGYISSHWNWNVGLFLAIPSILILAIVGGITLSIDGSQPLHFNKLDEIRANREIAVSRQEQIEAVVVAELRKYPEIEQQIINNINPEIILSYPELKSNETISQAANELKNAQDSIFAYDFERNQVLKEILNTEKGINLRSPFIETYQDRYGQPNPLTVQ